MELLTRATAKALAKTFNALVREGWGSVSDQVAESRRQLERCIADTGIPKVNAEMVVAAYEDLIRAIVAEAMVGVNARMAVPDHVSDPAKEQCQSAPEGYDVI